MALSLADLTPEQKQQLLEEALLEQQEKARVAKESKELDQFILQVNKCQNDKKQFRVTLAKKEAYWRPEGQDEADKNYGFTLNILNPDQLVSPILTLKDEVVPLVRKAVNKALLRVVPVDHKESFVEGKRLDKGSIRPSLEHPDTSEAGRILSLDTPKALVEIEKVGNLNTLNYMLDAERQGKNLEKRTRTNVVSALHDRVRTINNKLPGVAKITPIVEEEPDPREEVKVNVEAKPNEDTK